MNHPKQKIPVKALLITSAWATAAGMALVILLELFTNVPGRWVTTLGGAGATAVGLLLFPRLRP